MSMNLNAFRQSIDVRSLGRVAVVYGGTSAERAVSLQSGQGVIDALREQGVDVLPCDGLPALFDAIAANQVDRVFNILHGDEGENGVLQGALDAIGMPYTGSGVLGSALGMDKRRCKDVWLSRGLPTPEFAVIRNEQDVAPALERLGLPVIIKPACEGSSVGISWVYSEADLPEALALAKKHQGDLLMERLIEGDELTVGIVGDVALPSIRIVPAAERYDYHAKYEANDTQYLCPGAEGEQEAALQALSLAAFEAVGCHGWGRVDVMRDKNGQPYLLEVNTAPGMTSHSLVPKAAKQIGLAYGDLCVCILGLTMNQGGAA